MQHGAVADQLGVGFFLDLLGGGAGANQRVEAGERSAGDGDEQHREHGNQKPVTEGFGEGRVLDLEAAKQHTDGSHDDRRIQEVTAQVTAGLQAASRPAERRDQAVDHDDHVPDLLRCGSQAGDLQAN